MKINRYSLVLVTVCIVLSVGCTSGQRYTYDAIRDEYADLTCNLPPVNQPTAGHKVCSLEGPVTVEDAVKIARANNPDILMATARIRQASAMIGKSTAAYYPSVGFYTEYLQGDSPSMYLFKKIDARKLPERTDFNDPGWFENFESGITAGINVYNGGRDRLRRMMSESETAAAQWDRQAVENLVVSTVIQVFYDVLATRQFITAAEESVETVKSQLKVMTVRFDSGGALKSDILSLQVRLDEATEALLKSRNRYRVALSALANIMGIHPDTPLTIVEKNTIKSVIPAVYEEGVNEALKTHPALAKAREHLRWSRMAVDYANYGYLPRIDINTKYYFDDPGMDYEQNQENWMAGIYLNWTLFKGFSTKWDSRKANAVLEEMIAADRKTVLNIQFDVRKAYLSLEEAEQRLIVAKSRVSTAQESLSLVKKQYEGGSATITRYLEAELDRNNARISEAAAFYDKQKALAEIGRTIGIWHRPDTAE
ncbi:MAG: TolC family protein [Desulfobacteraceae bacterium]|nr:TolC family protein [Desulfobacteraceae bacterium]